MNLRRVFAAAVVLALAAPLSADWPEIQKRGTLKVLVNIEEQTEMFNFEGGTYYKAGGPPGFERELLDGFAKLHKVKIELVPTKAFSDIIPALLKKEGDLIVGIVDTEARRKLIDFTTEVMPVRQVVVTRKPRPVVTTLDAFRKEKVGVVKGTSWAAAAEAAGIPVASTQLYAGTHQVVNALKSGEITATVMAISDLTLLMRREPELQAGLTLGTPGSAGWGVRKEDVQLRTRLSEYLDNTRKGAIWSRLVVKYFGEDALPVLKTK